MLSLLLSGEHKKQKAGTQKRKRYIRGRKYRIVCIESEGKGNMKFCPKCGREMEDTQRFCPICGYDMAGQKTTLQRYNGGQQNYNNGQQQNYYNGQQQNYNIGQQQYNGGYQQMPYNYGYAQPGIDYRKTTGMGIAALVCSLIGIFFFGAILDPLAIIFGGVGISQCNSQPNVYKGKGLAIAGLVIGILGLAFNILIIVMMGSALGLMAL